MRIPLVQNSYGKINNSRNQSFQGLWGETTRVLDKDTVLGVRTDYETYYYYPFADEFPDEIQEVVDNNTDAYFDEKSGCKYVVKECKVCMTLPFKEVHFNNYQKADSSTRMTQNLKRVHYSVKDKYINNKGEQESAVNPAMSSKLNLKA